jgi:hypothetical protein
MTDKTYERIDFLLTKLTENEAFEGSIDSFLSFLSRSNATYIDGESLFTPNTTHILIQSQDLEINAHEFLRMAQRNLARFGYNCDICGEMADSKDVLDQEIFKFKAKRPQRWIIIQFLDFFTPNLEVKKHIFDISQFVIHVVKITTELEIQLLPIAEMAFDKKTFSIVADSFDWDTIQHEMDTMIQIETCGLHLQFQNSEVWHRIFNEIPTVKIVEEIIKWNTRVKLTTHHTNIPMFLLTMIPVENPTLRDVLYVIYPKDQRYIWNIYWDKLSVSQQRAAKPLIQNNDTHFHDGTSLEMLTEESNFEQKFISGIVDKISIVLPPTCIDIVNSEMEQDLNLFVREDTDNIVLLFPIKNKDQPVAACYSRNLLHQSPIFYSCDQEDSMNPNTSVRLAYSYFRLDVREFPIFISQYNFAYLLESTDQFFIVTETPTRLNFTVSKSVQDGTSDLVSADHCQAGSDKTISVIIGLDADTIQNAVDLAKGGSNKWRKKYPTHINQE